MTTAEAAERWRISAITVKQACSGQKGLTPRFKEGEEFRKSGRTWLVTKAGMERMYGKKKRIAGRKVGRSWRPESPINENGTV